MSFGSYTYIYNGGKDNENIYLELYNDKIKVKSLLPKENFDINSLDNERIIAQISKTGNTIFNIKNTLSATTYFVMSIYISATLS